MEVKTNPIYVSFTFDKNYIIPFYVSITSICLNSKLNPIIFHVITTGIDEEGKGEIKQYVNQYGAEIHFHTVDEESVAKFYIADDSYFTSTIFYRLFIPLLVPPEVVKLIYLDTDTISIGDLACLYNIPLNNTPVGAIYDKEMYGRGDIGIFDRKDYFNSGVLLINVIEWRTQNITKKAIEFILNNPKGLKFPDQDALNVALKNNWLKLEQKYNVMKIDVPILNKRQMQKYILDKVIIHYNDNIKPWTKGINHSLKYLFTEYYALLIDSKIGKTVINKNIKNQLTHLILTDLLKEGDDFETRIQLGFTLHLCWINAINKVFNDEKYSIILKEEYCKSNVTGSDSMVRYFISEFENNRAILLNNYKQIMNSEGSKKNSSISWVRKWQIACEEELVAIKFLDANGTIKKLNELTETPDWINNQLGIPKVFALLLYYFINRCMDTSIL